MVKRGIPRHKAHELLRKVHRDALRGNKSAIEALIENDEIRRLFTKDELEELLNPNKYLGSYKDLIKRTLEYAKSVIYA